MLVEFHKHTVLNGKLVLQGGTALNLFYLDLARRSVDIDLNYIGNIDREATLKERPQIVTAVEQISGGLGYKLQNCPFAGESAPRVHPIRITTASTL